MTDYEKYTQQYFKEIFLLNSLYKKLVAFLETEDQCKAVGYKFYKSYYWHSGNMTAKTYIIDTNDGSHTDVDYYNRDGIRIDLLSHDGLRNYYRIATSFKGDTYLNYFRKFIYDHSMKVDYDITAIMDPNTKSYVVFSSSFLTSNKYTGVKPGEEFNPLDIMKYIITRITPSYVVGLINIERIQDFLGRTEEFRIHRLDLDGVMKFKSLIDAIITGKINLPYQKYEVQCQP